MPKSLRPFALPALVLLVLKFKNSAAIQSQPDNGRNSNYRVLFRGKL